MAKSKPKQGPSSARKAPATKADAAAAKAPKKMARGDGWSSVITGLGMQSKDKLVSNVITWEAPNELECEHLYSGSDVAGKIVDCLPEDALREGVTWLLDPDEKKATQDYFEELGVFPRLKQTWEWARCYGGAALLINVDDGKTLDKPLVPKAVRSILGFTPLSRWELQAEKIDVQLNSRTYGMPLMYRLALRRGGADQGGNGTAIHASRLLRFDGAKLPIRLFVQNNYWHDSVLTRAADAIRNYSVSHHAAALVMQEFNQGIFKMKDLALLMSSGHENDIIERLAMVQLARSVARAVIIDEEEEYTTVGAQLSGVDAMLEQIGSRLVAASSMPHTKLLGRSPSGLGATGESEENNWYDFVAAQQKAVLLPKMKFLLQLALQCRKGPTSGKVPENWGLEFNPLKQMTEDQWSVIRERQARVDDTYIANGVLDEGEVAVSRFGSGEYSTETTIDMRSRDALGKLPPPEDDEKPDPAALKGSGKAGK